MKGRLHLKSGVLSGAKAIVLNAAFHCRVSAKLTGESGWLFKHFHWEIEGSEENLDRFRDFLEREIKSHDNEDKGKSNAY